MSDTNSFIYRYHWDQEDLVDYPWPEHYVKQPEVERYLHHVVERHDLRKHFSFNTEMRSADFDESQNVWKLTTRHGDKPGETLTARFVVSALGLLSKRTLPDYPGIETFKGEMVCKPTSTVDWSFETNGRRTGSRLAETTFYQHLLLCLNPLLMFLAPALVPYRQLSARLGLQRQTCWCPWQRLNWRSSSHCAWPARDGRTTHFFSTKPAVFCSFRGQGRHRRRKEKNQ